MRRLNRCSSRIATVNGITESHPPYAAGTLRFSRLLSLLPGDSLQLLRRTSHGLTFLLQMLQAYDTRHRVQGAPFGVI